MKSCFFGNKEIHTPAAGKDHGNVCIIEFSEQAPKIIHKSNIHQCFAECHKTQGNKKCSIQTGKFITTIFGNHRVNMCAGKNDIDSFIMRTSVANKGECLQRCGDSGAKSCYFQGEKI